MDTFWSCKCQTPELVNNSCTALLIMSNKPLTFQPLTDSKSSTCNTASTTNLYSKSTMSEASRSSMDSKSTTDNALKDSETSFYKNPTQTIDSELATSNPVTGYHMESYEDGEGIEVLIQREQRHWRQQAGQNLFQFQTEVGHVELDLLLSWLCDVCWENSCSPELFTMASMLVNRFLSVCHINVCQLQLLAVACLVLAFKIRAAKHPDCSIPVSTLVQYADHCFTEEDVKTWEKLVLAKLNWDVNLVVPHDYLKPVLRLLQMATNDTVPHLHPRTSDSQPPSSDAVKNETVLGNAGLAVSLAHRSSQFGHSHPPRAVASASIILAIKSCQSKGEEILNEENLERLLRQRLCLDVDHLKDCCNQMETLLRADLPKSPAGSTKSSPKKSVTPPSLISPFKICSSSTPKRSRLPLRDGSNLPVESFRRRLHQQVDDEGNILDHSREEETVNKENNDSAIGMNASFNSISTPTTGRSPTTSASSVTSSPDSGASSVSPKSDLQNVQVIVDSLKKTKIDTPHSRATTDFEN